MFSNANIRRFSIPRNESQEQEQEIKDAIYSFQKGDKIAKDYEIQTPHLNSPVIHKLSRTVMGKINSQQSVSPSISYINNQKKR